MPRRHLLALALLVAIALAGCTQRSVEREAITEYLNAGYLDRAAGCPFPVDEEATEGIAGVSGAHGFAVGANAVTYVAFADRLETRTTDWSMGLTRSLDGTAEATRIAAGPDVVAVAREVGTNWTLTTYTPGLEPVANRTLGEHVGGLAVDANGSLLVADDPGPDGHEVTLYDRGLTVQTRIDLHPIEHVHDLATCEGRIYWASGGASGACCIRSRPAPDGWELINLGEVQDVAAGHDLVFASGGQQGRQRLVVQTVDGTELLELNNSQDRPYGTFEVAHGLVYNLRQGALLARPLADYLTRPS